MKIAVTYDNGNIFQHFGRSEFFKVYEAEDGKVVSSRVMGSEGQGHGALAGLLAENDIDVLICGGIGGGAQAALAAAGIELCAGASGDADAAVEAYLRGELVNSGANCDHHHHGEGHSCGHHGAEHGCGHHGENGAAGRSGDESFGGEESCCGHGGEEESCDSEACGSGCGGCCGGAGNGITGKNVGKTCRVHYRGTFNDGTQFDSSYDRGEPLEFTCGAGMMIRGFDAAVADMEPGQVVDVHLMPEEAYGPKDPNAIFTIDVRQLPGSENLKVGEQVFLSDGMRPFRATVVSREEMSITFDANHEMAGKELNFRIELVEVK